MLVASTSVLLSSLIVLTHAEVKTFSQEELLLDRRKIVQYGEISSKRTCVIENEADARHVGLGFLICGDSIYSDLISTTDTICGHRYK